MVEQIHLCFYLAPACFIAKNLHREGKEGEGREGKRRGEERRGEGRKGRGFTLPS